MLAKQYAEQARIYLSDGKVKQALDILWAYFKETKDTYETNLGWRDLRDNIILKRNALNRIKGNEYQDVRSHQEINQTINQITNATLKFITELEKLEKEKNTTFQNTARSRNEKYHDNVINTSARKLFNDREDIVNEFLNLVDKPRFKKLIDKFLEQDSSKQQAFQNSLSKIQKLNKKSLNCEYAGEWVKENGIEMGFKILEEVFNKPFNKSEKNNETTRENLLKCVKKLFQYSEYFLSKGIVPDIEKITTYLTEKNILQNRYYHILEDVFSNYVSKLEYIYLEKEWDRPEAAYFILLGHIQNYHAYFLR